MPLYEYACGACGVVSEISHRLSEPSPTDCPECGKPALSKQISAVGFRLKGEGWYETDFKDKGQRNLAGDKASGTSGADSKAASSSDSKSSSGTKSTSGGASTPAAGSSSTGKAKDAKPAS